MVLILDIDDTIVSNFTEPIESVINFVHSLPHDIYVVTGRPKSTRETTVKLLDSINLRYKALIMNPYSTRESNKHKAEVAHILKGRAVMAIDDNPNARQGYFDQGIIAIDPAVIYAPKF